MKNNTNAKMTAVHRPLPEEIILAHRVLSGKWRLIILWHLCNGEPQRFGEIKKNIFGLTQHVLTITLRDLEQEGLIRREAFSEVPSRVEYSVTDKAQALRPILAAMYTWGAQYINVTEYLKSE
jgi:DNA-binding HxlR family transcriptional regulator